MRRLIFVLGITALSLIALQLSVNAQITPASNRLQQSPLAVYPGFGHDPAADEAQFERESLAREMMIQECMKQQGLLYIVAQPVKIEGATTLGQGSMAMVEDPNVTYANTLTPENRKVYYMAWYGVPDPNTLSGELYDPNSPGGGGCQGIAFSSIAGVYAVQSALNEQYMEMRRSVQEDPRVRAAEQSWAQCMQKRGHQYATPREMLAESDMAAIQGQAVSKSTEQQQQSVEAAGDCGTEVGLDAVITQVRVDKEAAFVLANQDVLNQHLERLRSEEALVTQALNQ